MPGGSRVEGATRRTRAPMAASRIMLERATRECRMSPQIATMSPSMRPLLRRIVSASRSAWVGCSCAPSPALTTEQSTFCARRCTAPAAWWRTMMMSGRMALRVTAVSMSVSPFFTEDEATDMFITSAPSRLPAISKDDCVRVEGSKKRLIWVRPRRVDFFFSTCRLTSTCSSARSSKRLNVQWRQPLDAEQMAMGKNGAGGGAHLKAMAIGRSGRRRQAGSANAQTLVATLE